MRAAVTWALVLGLLAALVAPSGRALAQPGAAGPPAVTLDQVVRVDPMAHHRSYRPLFPDLGPDREAIARLLVAYNTARPEAGPALEYEYPEAVPFLPRLAVRLGDGSTLWLVPVGSQGVNARLEEAEWGLPSAALAAFFEGEPSRYFRPAQGLSIEPRALRLGEVLRVRGDCTGGSPSVAVLLQPWGDPGAAPPVPPPFDTSEAVLVGEYPAPYDTFDVSIPLTGEMGRKADGTPGRITPGWWKVVVAAAGRQSWAIVVLPPPSGAAEAVVAEAVVVDGGRAGRWTPAVPGGAAAAPAWAPLAVEDCPLAVTGEGLGDGVWVTDRFLREVLGVEAVWEGTPGEAGSTLVLGGLPDPVRIPVGTDRAACGTTGVDLEGPLVWDAGRGTARLPFFNMAPLFGYRVVWLGPDRVAFLHNLDGLPAGLLPALPPAGPSSWWRSRLPGDPEVVVYLAAADGSRSPVVFAGPHPYLSLAGGRVMVPLRETVEALGGRVQWCDLAGYVWNSESMANPFANLGLQPWGGGVASFVLAEAGGRGWTVYLAPGSGGGAPGSAGPGGVPPDGAVPGGGASGDATVYVPLRLFAEAFGYRAAWDGAARAVELVTLGQDAAP